MDTIADMLTRIRNAGKARQKYVDIPLSSAKVKIAEIFKESGWVGNFLTSSERRMMRIFLKYNKARKPIFTEIKRHSKPGLRSYVGYKEIPRICNGMGIAIVSTTQGMMDGKKAKEMKLGGELICSIW